MAMWREIGELHRRTTLGAKEGLAFRFFSRPLASFILYFIRDGRITPNQVTIASLIVGVGGSVVHVLWLEWAGLLVGAGLFMIAHMLDALDGQLARLRKAGSVVGMYFDFFIDELKAYFVFIGIGIRLWRQERETDADSLLDPLVEAAGAAGPDLILLIGLAGITGLAIGISCTQFVKRKEWLEAFPATQSQRPPSGLARVVALVERAGRFVIDYPSYILLVCLVDHVEIYFAIYAAVCCVYALRALFQIARKLWLVDPYAAR